MQPNEKNRAAPRRDDRWSVMDVLRESTRFLERKGIENPRTHSERLMAMILGCTRLDLYLRFEDVLSTKERQALKALLHRRAMGEPLQYILEETEFMSLPFRLTSDVLIPRPETEILVEAVIRKMKPPGRVRLLDVGVGSGNIAVSLASYIPAAEITGVDLESGVIKVARENAELNGVADRIRFIRADVTADGFSGLVEHGYDGCVSNPPYVSLEAWETLPREIREYEPRTALCDEGTGLRFFHIIASAAWNVLRGGGSLFFEVGDSQAEPVVGILEKNGYTGIETVPDLNRIPRVVFGMKPVRE